MDPRTLLVAAGAEYGHVSEFPLSWGKAKEKIRNETRKETIKEGKHLGRKPQEGGKLELT